MIGRNSMLRALAVGAIVLVIAPAASARTGGGAAHGRARASCSWTIATVPGGFELHAISAVSASDIWAVGNGAAMTKPFALHYDGSNWKAFKVPTRGAGPVHLYDVDAFSKANAWAVGSYVNGAGHSRTLIEHWNGSGWTVVPSPNRGAGDNTLRGVAAVNGSRAWAVGFTGAAPGDGPLIERWNGSSWSLFPPAGLGGISHALEDVAVIASDNVVAVGHRGDGAPPTGTHVERFDGSAWHAESSVDAPVGNLGSELRAVSAPSAGAQWAVGAGFDQHAHQQTLAERNLGHGWVLEPPNNVGAMPNALQGVSALSATNAFAVGSFTTSGGTRRALAERFANGSWTTFKPPNATQFDNELESVTAISGSNVWAVGYAANDPQGSNREPLVEHFHC